MNAVIFSIVLLVSVGISSNNAARWSKWQDLTICSAKPCNCTGNEQGDKRCSTGKKVEIRMCIRGENDTGICQWEGNTGAIKLNKKCENLNKCPGWSDWTPADLCNCQKKTRLMKRVCDNPAPIHPDVLCIDENTDEQKRVMCKKEKCNCTDGPEPDPDFPDVCQSWSSWTPRKECNCETNTREVRRVCENVHSAARVCLDEIAGGKAIEQIQTEDCECEEKTTTTMEPTTPLRCCDDQYDVDDMYGEYGGDVNVDDLMKNLELHRNQSTPTTTTTTTTKPLPARTLSQLEQDYIDLYESIINTADCRPCGNATEGGADYDNYEDYNF